MANENDIEFVKKLGELYEKHIEKYQGLLVLNPEQYKKFLIASELFHVFVESNGGEIIESELEPKDLHGYLEANIPLISANGASEVANFCRLLAHTTAVDITPKADGESIYLGLTVPNVFTQLKK